MGRLDMKVASYLVCLILSIWLGGLAQAQTAKPSFQSSGLKVSIAGITARNNMLTIQFLIENIAQSRQYILIPRDNTGSLGSGADLQVQSVAGINSYLNAVSQDVVSVPVYTELQKMSYLDPGTSTVFSMRYYVQHGSVEPDETVSFSFKAVVRKSAAVGELAPEASDKAGSPHVVNINFPLVPFKLN